MTKGPGRATVSAALQTASTPQPPAKDTSPAKSAAQNDAYESDPAKRACRDSDTFTPDWTAVTQPAQRAKRHAPTNTDVDTSSRAGDAMVPDESHAPRS